MGARAAACAESNRGVIEVTGSPDGRRLISGLWRIFTSSYQVQKGDRHMDRSRGLLQRHHKRMDPDDKNIILGTYKKWVSFTSSNPLVTCNITAWEVLERASKRKATPLLTSKETLRLGSIGVKLRRCTRLSW